MVLKEPACGMKTFEVVPSEAVVVVTMFPANCPRAANIELKPQLTVAFGMGLLLASFTSTTSG